jgi:hypothetical protein
LEAYPRSFDEGGVQNLLPSMETLHISSIFKKRGDFLPILCSILLYKLFESFVFFRSPPMFLGYKGGVRMWRGSEEKLLICNFFTLVL